MEDDRFSRFSTDPKFRTVPKKQRKVKVDERFAGVFQEKKFVSKSKVDKRGRPQLKFNSKENFRKYYNLEEPSLAAKEKSDSEDDEDEEDGQKKKKLRNKLKDLSVDYARGEGTLDSESSSSSEEEEEDDDTDNEEEVNEEVITK